MTITQSGAPQCSALRDAACRRCWKLPTHNVSCRFSSFSARFYDALDERIMWLAAQLDRHALDAADQCWVEIQSANLRLRAPLAATASVLWIIERANSCSESMRCRAMSGEGLRKFTFEHAPASISMR